MVRLALALVLALSAACATPRADIAALDVGTQFVEGRLSIRYRDGGSGKEDALSGRFVWTRDAATIALDLYDPLGQSVAHVSATPARASIRFRDGRTVDGATAEAVTRDALGYALPVRGLADWLDGRTTPGADVSSLDDGRVRQDGWTIRFVRPDGDASAAPRRIDLDYPGPPAEIEMRLVVDRRGTGAAGG